MISGTRPRIIKVNPVSTQTIYVLVRDMIGTPIDASSLVLDMDLYTSDTSKKLSVKVYQGVCTGCTIENSLIKITPSEKLSVGKIKADYTVQLQDGRRLSNTMQFDSEIVPGSANIRNVQRDIYLDLYIDELLASESSGGGVPVDPMDFVGAQFMGIANTGTDPVSTDQSVFYFASGKGTYSNFNVEIPDDSLYAIKKATGAQSGWEAVKIFTSSGSGSGGTTDVLNTKLTGLSKMLSLIHI